MDNGDLKNLLMDMESIATVGNITPRSWYSELVRERGGAHFPAIIILSELVYRYRPVTVTDEDGNITIQKKFRGDLFQASYKYWEKFGLTRKQARNGVDYLVARGLIEKIIDTEPLTLPSGTTINNRQYLVPIPSAISAITYHEKRATGVTVSAHPPALQGTPPCPTGHTPLPYRAHYMI